MDTQYSINVYLDSNVSLLNISRATSKDNAKKMYVSLIEKKFLPKISEKELT